LILKTNSREFRNFTPLFFLTKALRGATFNGYKADIELLSQLGNHLGCPGHVIFAPCGGV
jgi:hypothetical protein